MDQRGSVVPMHHNRLSVRMKIAPSETASEAFMGSPPMELVAGHANVGEARGTYTSAFCFAAYSRSPASTGDADTTSSIRGMPASRETHGRSVFGLIVTLADSRPFRMANCLRCQTIIFFL